MNEVLYSHPHLGFRVFPDLSPRLIFLPVSNVTCENTRTSLGQRSRFHLSLLDTIQENRVHRVSSYTINLRKIAHNFYYLSFPSVYVPAGRENSRLMKRVEMFYTR